VSQPSISHKLLAVVFAVPAIITVAVGADRLLRALGMGQLNLPDKGVWAIFVGLCCLATGWVAWQGLSALWRRV
jgi:hypothetical protein